jgi:transcriptional regulator with XRE-family HTH domain
VLIDDFKTASITKLAALTGIDKSRWSRYLNGKVAMTTTTLSIAASRLGMTQEDLLRAINDAKNN